MGMYARLRRFSFLVFAFLALSGAAQAQFALALETKEIEAANTVTMVVTSNGAIDLSGITPQQVRFFDFSLGDNQNQRGGMGARTVEATARRLTVTVGIGNPARVLGRRHMLLMFGETFVAFPFTLVRPFVCPADCRLPRMCINKQCVLPPTKCVPRCNPPMMCNEAKRRCERPPT